jgi:HEAT repeat protein
MSLRREIRTLLQQGHETALAELARTNPRAVAPLVGRLWDPDQEIRERAARAIGHAAAAHADLGLEVIRRLIWALNDESATNGVHGIPALGEIGRKAPELLAPFVPTLTSMTEDAGLRCALLRALKLVAETAPHLVVDHLQQLESCIDQGQPRERQALDQLIAATEKETRHGD